VEGNLTRDPETKTLASGNMVCDFTLATNRFYKGGNSEAFEKEVSYFDVEAWSRLGTACSQNLKKGRGVRVVGRLKQDRWLDPEGKPRTKIKIVAEHVEFKPPKPVTEGEEPQVLEVDSDTGRSAVF
jgi:single-strand DNA-binding protein